MPDVLHSGLGPGNGHRTQHWEVANAAARLALSVVENQAGKICRQLDDNTFYVLRKVAGGVSWARIDFEGAQVSDAAPLAATPTAASAGSSPDASRADHKHAIPVAVPVAIGAANAAGSADTLARSDHVHALSPADRAKLDASGPTTPLTAAAPAAVTKAAAVVGISTDAARADHKHDVSTAVPVSVAQANAEGSSASLARADHAHDHGAQPLGTGNQHAVATTTVAGFCSAADKVKIDASIAGPTPATSTANGIVRYADTGARLAKNSGVTIDDSNNISGVGAITASGALSGASCTVSGTLSGASLGGTVGSIPFVTIGNSGALAGERALTAGQGIAITDGGANSTVTVATNFDPTAKADKGFSSIVSHAWTTRNIVLTDLGALIYANGAGEQDVLIQLDATLNLPIGFATTLVRGPTPSLVGVDWAVGVTVIYDSTLYAPECKGVGSSISLVKIAANTWWLSGDLNMNGEA